MAAHRHTHTHTHGRARVRGGIWPLWLLNDSAFKGRQHYFAHGRATSALESRQHYFAHPSSMSECARDYRQEARRMRSYNQQVRGGGAAATGSTPLPGWQTFLTAAATVCCCCYVCRFVVAVVVVVCVWHLCALRLLVGNFLWPSFIHTHTHIRVE